MAVRRTSTDWALFAFLAFLWASAYAMTRGAVSTLPTELIVPGRLLLGASVLVAFVHLRGEKWPPLSNRKIWAVFAAMGMVGTVAPFFLITTAQQTVDSSLAGLYVSAAPIFVSISAHFLFQEERMNSMKAAGIGIGFVGVLVLFGPDVIENWGSASVIAQFLLLIATMMYATSTLIARAAPRISPVVFAAGFLSFGAVFSLPMLAFVSWGELQPSTASVLNLIGLGLGPSAIASLIYPILVNRAGPTFLSLTGYVIPILAAIIGWVLYREVLSWNAYLAFGLIIAGVYVSQQAMRPKPLVSQAE